MNRNAESHFALNPTNIDLSRSRFDMSFGSKTSFNVGEIIPLCRPIEVLPGDTFSLTTSKVIRLQTLLKPVFGDLMFDLYAFFVPNRIVWSHWKQFMGENTQSAWLPSTTYSVPQILGGNAGWPVGSVADHYGLPVGVTPNDGFNALPFRGYAKICDEWFRSEVLTDPLVIPDGDSTVTYNQNAAAAQQPALGGAPFIAAKYFDYFTAALPAPQKGPDVNIPMEALGNNNGWIPVKAFDAVHTSYKVDDPFLKGYFNGSTNSFSLRADATENVEPALSQGVKIGGVGAAGTSGSSHRFWPSNLWAQGSLFTCDINSLRLAFQIQKLYEKDARGGTRYIEILKSHFGVTSPDSRLQRPEYLGGNRIPIQISEVTNNTQSSGNYLGDLGAMSRTTDVHADFTHSFTEHGYIHILGVARYSHSYEQGTPRTFLRRNRLDYYWPVLANIGEQPVYKAEIFTVDGQNMLSTPPTSGQIFGYQEAWADYRYMPDQVSGMLRGASNSGLDSWHFGDFYASAPTLSDGWIREDKGNVDRALTVQSSTADQIFADFYFDLKATRCMPVYSIPGLIDHH